jgi:2-oxoglutarate dehydrogenase E2 component (dihydrolipoamide succinyltransferase)
MSEKILVPTLGESINEATIAKWLKNKGDMVTADEPIVELETDKVNLEVPSPVSGTLSKINAKDGSAVKVGAVLGEVTESNSENKVIEKIKISKPEQKKEENNIVNLDIEKRSEPSIFEEKDLDPEPLILTKEISKEKSNKTNKPLSPSVRKIVSEKKS